MKSRPIFSFGFEYESLAQNKLSNTSARFHH